MCQMTHTQVVPNVQFAHGSSNNRQSSRLFARQEEVEVLFKDHEGVIVGVYVLEDETVAGQEDVVEGILSLVHAVDLRCQ